jgi:hypothetical protein
MDHSVAMNSILEKISWNIPNIFRHTHFAIQLALQRVRELQEQAAVSDDPVSRF